MSIRARTRHRVRALVILLGILALILAVDGILRRLPHEPRLYLANQSFRPLPDNVMRSACGDLVLPELSHGQSVRLDLAPRPGCRYTIAGETLDGDELLRLFALGRARKADVEIEVGIDYVHADLTMIHKRW